MKGLNHWRTLYLVNIGFWLIIPVYLGHMEYSTKSPMMLSERYRERYKFI